MGDNSPVRDDFNDTTEHQAPGGSSIDGVNLDTTRDAGSSGESPLKKELPELPLMGRYKLQKRLGDGGMGTVFQAYDNRLLRDVALKIPKMPRNAGNASQSLNRFYREAKIAAGFTHPNLCAVYDVGEFEGIHFLTMPLIPGESLGDRLKRVKRVAIPEAVRFVGKIAEAMAVAHAAGVIHRDLKPDNVMLRPPNDEPVVMDFGLAVSDQPQLLRMTSQGTFLGTPAYCSPEHLAGDLSTVGPPWDVFSLGVIFYQLLTGSLPFTARLRTQDNNSDSSVYVPPSDLNKDVTPPIDQICRLALARHPKDRFASMSLFAEALSHLSEHAETPARSLQPVETRGKLPVAKLLISFAILAGTSAAGYLATRPSKTSAKARPVDAPVVPKLTTKVESLSKLSERFAPNSNWKGDFSFKPMADKDGSVSLRVMKRDGSKFQGIYRSEDQYEWEVAGTVVDDEVNWSFVRAIKDAPHGMVVGSCDCRVTDQNGILVGEFVNHAMNMKASLRLRLQP